MGGKNFVMVKTDDSVKKKSHRNQNSGSLWWGKRISRKKPEETEAVINNILHFHRGMDYTGICIYQNSLNYIFKICMFYCKTENYT